MTAIPIPLDEVLGKVECPLPVTTDNLVSVVRQVMEVVEAYTQSTGEQKKQAVLECVDALMRSTDAGALEAVEPVVLALLPHLIDELVVCSHTGIHINQQYRRRCRLSCVFTLLRNTCCRACA